MEIFLEDVRYLICGLPKEIVIVLSFLRSLLHPYCRFLGKSIERELQWDRSYVFMLLLNISSSLCYYSLVKTLRPPKRLNLLTGYLWKGTDWYKLRQLHNCLICAFSSILRLPELQNLEDISSIFGNSWEFLNYNLEDSAQIRIRIFTKFSFLTNWYFPK